ncbi:MAG: hypothetical protein RLZZ165_539 [Bacteroidota bacterium]
MLARSSEWTCSRRDGIHPSLAPGSERSLPRIPHVRVHGRRRGGWLRHLLVSTIREVLLAGFWPRSSLYPAIITSAAYGGVIIAWNDLRSGNVGIHAPRIHAAEELESTSDGVAIPPAAGHTWRQAITSDGAGGAIIARGDFRCRTRFDIRAHNNCAGGTSPV